MDYAEMYSDQEVRCPGKEITGMVFGINALFWSVFGLFFSWIPMYGIIFAVVYGAIAIGCGITAIVLYNKAKAQATVLMGKGKIGKNLGIAGIIVAVVLVVISIVITLILVLVVGVAAFGASSSYNSGSSYYYMSSIQNIIGALC